MTDFTYDILNMTWNDSELENDELANYKAKAEYYIRQHQDTLAIAKLRTNRPFTDRGSIVEVFTDINVWMGIRSVIEQINANAAA